MQTQWVLYVTWNHAWPVGEASRWTHNKEYVYHDLLLATQDQNRCRAYKHVEHVQLVEETV